MRKLVLELPNSYIVYSINHTSYNYIYGITQKITYSTYHNLSYYHRTSSPAGPIFFIKQRYKSTFDYNIIDEKLFNYWEQNTMIIKKRIILPNLFELLYFSNSYPYYEYEVIKESSTKPITKLCLYGKTAGNCYMFNNKNV